jgi:peptidoglycan-N-acetylglucosamine deacetylase
VLVFIFITFAVFVFYRIINSRTFQFYGGIISRVPTHEKVVALTFDDGPTGRTPDVLALLKELDIKATFFVTGNSLQQHMEYGRMIVEAGHEPGNHSYSHKRMIFSSFADIKDEIEKTDSLIVKAGYTGPIYFRPPYGKKFFLLPYYLHRHNRKTVMWDVEPDSRSDAGTQSIIADAVGNVQPGSIILLHVMVSSRDNSMKAIKGIVTALRNKGYKFVTVSGLTAYDGK